MPSTALQRNGTGRRGIERIEMATIPGAGEEGEGDLFGSVSCM